MKALILAGGSGTRLWPLSRNRYPKQFLRLEGKESLLQKTLLRALHKLSPQEIFILTQEEYFHEVAAQVDEVSPLLKKNILLEPCPKNTAAALSYALRYIADRCPDEIEQEIFWVAPSDHLIAPLDRFWEHMQRAEARARTGKIVTFGIRPTRPEIGYGYIHVKKGVFEGFVEKPPLEVAKSYLEGGEHFWNSGMFLFPFALFQRELARYCPTFEQLFQVDLAKAGELFATLPSLSIDHALMEKTQEITMIPLDLSWSDVGSWENVYDLREKDSAHNVLQGDVTLLDVKNSLALATSRHLALIGVEDLCVIETEDVVLVTKKEASQKVKELAAQLKAQGRKEMDEPPTSYRPWGSYTVLEEGSRYKIKKILVKPLQKLSLQMHYHRSEHWVIVSGTAKVTIGEEETIVHEGESIFVPKSARHRVENPGKVTLEMIEVQVGEYLGEDDIVRFEDIYGRLSCIDRQNSLI